MLGALLEKYDISLPMLGGFLVAVVAALLVIFYCFTLGDPLMPLYAMVSAALGWLIGILSAPLNKGEEGRFSQFAKIITGFITGYLLSKIDRMVVTSLTPDSNGNYPIFEAIDHERFLISIISFLVALITIYNARSYWSKPASNKEADPIKA